MNESKLPVFNHVPVMLDQAMEQLNLHPGKVWVDATAGYGGHLQEMIKRLNGDGKFIGIDRDNQTLSLLKEKISGQANLFHANYSDIESVLEQAGESKITGGILADLGVSSRQLDDADRGFSFLRDGPLDMRMDQTQTLTAEKIVNSYSEKELAEIIFIYGEERHSRRIAKRIVENRPFKNTLELAELVRGCVRPSKFDESHPATRTFQALRIEVNDELGNLKSFLRKGIELLAPGARFVVITFHSLEDRIVKQIFKESALNCICPPRQPVCTCTKRSELLVITRKPIVADIKEVLANPRARSAKLRAGEKLVSQENH
ncbi:MAG: 16S rRNA (cytosine(1402)-N(4))-methyltransferase RsmH [Candidatus Obscuribacterales bacterium]|nr:16S rRNA (cytosine(1402)-N(4))-methyltransferase RsmH [Candidatus Obscuribacterales bacterium]